MPVLLRYLWALPNTCLGMLVALPSLAFGARGQIVDGVLEVYGRPVRWLLRHAVPLRGGASAMALGHVVLARDAACLERTRQHERIHVRQAERWGPFFIPAYLLASVLVFIQGNDPYYDNPFEREAHDHA